MPSLKPRNLCNNCTDISRAVIFTDVSLAVTNACQVVLRLHLLVSIDKKMIEFVNANESEPRIFHVGKSVKGDGQSRGKNEHVNPAARFGSGHTEASK